MLVNENLSVHRICNAIYCPRAEVELKYSIARGTNPAKAANLSKLTQNKNNEEDINCADGDSRCYMC